MPATPRRRSPASPMPPRSRSGADTAVRSAPAARSPAGATRGPAPSEAFPAGSSSSRSRLHPIQCATNLAFLREGTMLRNRLGVRVLVAAVLLGTAVPAVVSAQPYHMEDSLRGGTMGNPSGGSFGPDGWTVTGVEDRIWYALPRLESGFVEFTMTNLTLDRLPLPDHEMF